jgi:peptide/nickel transport system permease protein
LVTVDPSASLSAIDTEGAPELTSASSLRAALEVLSRDKLAIAGLLFIVIASCAAIAAPWISPYDPLQTDLSIRLSPPGAAGHVLGTDEQGRDLLSRIIWGGRLSLLGGILPVAISGVCGYALGLLAGYNGGFISSLIMRMQDVFYAFPAVLLAIGISAALGPGFIHVTMSLVVVIIPAVARIAHAASLSVMSQEYIEAAKASGARGWQVIVYHVVVNSFSPVLVYCTTLIGLVIVFASGLSFLGLGVQPPSAEWGAMVGQLKNYILNAPVVVAMPGLMILIVSMAFNFLGDGLRDALDPHLRIA